MQSNKKMDTWCGLVEEFLSQGLQGFSNRLQATGYRLQATAGQIQE